MNTASLILILAAQIPAGLIRLDATIDTPPGEPPLHATTWAIYDDTSGTVTDSELRMMGLGWSGHPETRDGVHLGHDQLDWDLFTGLDSPHWAVRWDLPATEHLLALSGSIDTSHGGAFWRHGEDILFNPTWIAVASTRTALGALVPEPHGVTFAIIAAAVFAAVYWKSERAFEAKR